LEAFSARGYGTLLGQALFREEVRDAFTRALPKGDDRLHVQFFVEDADLKGLRWERLCAPLGGGWDFLALNQRTPFSLYLPCTTDQRFPPIGRLDLRALIVVASPAGLEQYRLAAFDSAATVCSVRAALGEKIPGAVLGMVEGAVGPPTLDALCERITAETFTMLHVVCHGRFQVVEGETILYLAGADGQVDPVKGTRLLDRLGKVRGARGLPQFAFLCTCESAVPEAGGALAGLAQRLVRELGMPAVVAMTEPVTVATAQVLAEAFYRRVREHGEVDRALSEACAGLAERHDVHVPVLYSRLGGRPLFSESLDRPLTNVEIAAGLDNAAELLLQRGPVLLPEFGKQAELLRKIGGADPTTLSPLARRDREQALTAANQVCEEALDLSFHAVALGQEPPPYDGRCPFRGLYPFRCVDCEFFFGREELIERLAGRLEGSGFLAVLGPSGSGKSSVVQAGLLPALERREKSLKVSYLTPGAKPLESFEANLLGHENLTLVVVDQFEELFTLCDDDGERRAFIKRLLGLARQVRVVLTMRADFWGECAAHPELRERMQACQELIGPMSTAELRRSMEGQAAKVGLRFEADLGATILDEVQDEPGAMPLLQHALLELWKRRHGRWLRAEEYRAIGGVKKAIAETAEAVYGELSQDQEGVRDIFVRLTRLGDDRPGGETRRDARQRVRLSELTRAGDDPERTKKLVHRLADQGARLLVSGVQPGTGEEVVELAHEALLRHWPRLLRWLEEDRADLRLLASVEDAARAWSRNTVDESLLIHRGSRLVEAERLRHHSRLFLNRIEADYVSACADLRDQERKEKEEQQQVARNALARAEFTLGQQAASQGRMDEALFRWLRSHDTTVNVEWAASMRNLIGGTASVYRCLPHDGNVGAVALSSDGTCLVVGYVDLLDRKIEKIAVWDAEKGRRVRPPFSIYSEFDFSAIAITPDGTRIVIGNDVGDAEIRDVKTGEAIKGFERSNKGAITCVAINSAGTRVVTGSADDTARVWDVETQ
jgi:hypothetical protein